MKDKEKQIEETIKEIAECNKEICKDCKIICTYFYAIKRFCEIFLPKDSVVLSKGAYESLSSKAKANVVNAIEIRKETAEKIYRMADEICTGSQNDGDKILAMIKDNFGVEIKENKND